MLHTYIRSRTVGCKERLQSARADSSNTLGDPFPCEHWLHQVSNVLMAVGRSGSCGGEAGSSLVTNVWLPSPLGSRTTLTSLLTTPLPSRGGLPLRNRCFATPLAKATHTSSIILCDTCLSCLNVLFSSVYFPIG